jgi:hypothetical protein
MFNSISWQEFLNTAIIALGLYYVVSVLIFYFRDAIARFGKASQPNSVDSESGPNYPLMGQIRKDTPKRHEHLVEAQDLQIDPSNTSKLERTEEGLLINSVSHLLREIKVLARVVKESNGSKADATPMFQSLLSNYSHLGATKFRESITLFIHDAIRRECVFEAALQEIDAWWPETESKNNNQ